MSNLRPIRDAWLPTDLVARILLAMPPRTKAEHGCQLLETVDALTRPAPVVPIETARAARSTKYPEASGTARKAPSGASSGAPSRNEVRASLPAPEERALPEPPAPPPLMAADVPPSPPAAAVSDLGAPPGGHPTPAPRSHHSDADRLIEIIRGSAKPVVLAAAAPKLSIGQAAPRKPAPIGWVEQRQAKLRAARAHLQRIGINCHACDRIGFWRVTGQPHQLIDTDVIQLAIDKGMPA